MAGFEEVACPYHQLIRISTIHKQVGNLRSNFMPFEKGKMRIKWVVGHIRQCNRGTLNAVRFLTDPIFACFFLPTVICDVGILNLILYFNY